MELNKNFGNNDIILGDVEESTEFRINIDSQNIIIDSLINLYENPIGSVVREITSNCVDAHRERDLKLNGLRKLEEDDDIKYFSDKNAIEIEYIGNNSLLGINESMNFIDHGIGLSSARVKEVFTVFGSSTKRQDNFEIGGFGLGSKSIFAYTDTFFIETVRNHEKRIYLLNRGISSPTMDLVFTESRKEYNYTKVIIPLKDSFHKNDFVREINRQLRYFPNLFFRNIDPPVVTDILFDNDDYIIDSNSSEAGILIDNVTYPINGKLLDDILIPKIGIKYKFKIGELDLVPSRESIRYTEETKSKITKRIKLVMQDAHNFITESLKEELKFISLVRKILTIKKYMKNYYTHYDIDGDRLLVMYCKCLDSNDLNYIAENADFNKFGFTLEELMDLDTLFAGFDFYEIEDTINSVRSKKTLIFNSTAITKNFYYSENNFSRAIDVTILKNEKCFYLMKYVPIKDKIINKNPQKLKRYEQIQKIIRDLVIKECVIYDNIAPSINIKSSGTIDYESQRKKDGKIFIRSLRKHIGYQNNASWNNDEIKISELPKLNIIYGTGNDTKKLEFLLELKINILSNYSIIKISKTNFKYFKNNKNINIHDFLSKNNILIKEFYTTNENKFFLNNNKYLLGFYNIAKNIYDLYNNMIKSAGDCNYYENNVKKSLLKYCNCTEKDLFCKDVEDKLNILKKYVKDLDFLKTSNSLTYGNLLDNEMNSLKTILKIMKKEVD